jgi:hypothetical protein
VLLLGPTGWEEAGAREEEVVRGEAGARLSRVGVEGGEFYLSKNPMEKTNLSRVPQLAGSLGDLNKINPNLKSFKIINQF